MITAMTSPTVTNNKMRLIMRYLLLCFPGNPLVGCSIFKARRIMALPAD
jgi:hypothetical protein